jgi:hypothetical protein
MEVIAAAKGVGSLIVAGAALALGFWLSRKLTNRIDQALFERSGDHKELLKRVGLEEAV